MALDPARGAYGIDIPAGVWHSLVVRAPGTVIYEVKAGPYAPAPDEDFAPWSPEPGDGEGIAGFLNRYVESD